MRTISTCVCGRKPKLIQTTRPRQYLVRCQCGRKTKNLVHGGGDPVKVWGWQTIKAREGKNPRRRSKRRTYRRNSGAFYIPPKRRGDKRPRNAFGMVVGFGKAYNDYHRKKAKRKSRRNKGATKTWVILNTRGPNVKRRGTRDSVTKYARTRFVNFKVVTGKRGRH